MVLIRPVLGEPRMVQATPATSGGANSGRMLAAAMKRLNGVLVRTTIQENVSPIATAIKVPPPQATSVLNSASPTFGLLSTVRKFVIERWARLKPSITGLVSVSAPSSRVRSGTTTRKARIASSDKTQAAARTPRRRPAQVSCSAPCSGVASSVKALPLGDDWLFFALGQYPTPSAGGLQ